MQQASDDKPHHWMIRDLAMPVCIAANTESLAESRVARGAFDVTARGASQKLAQFAGLSNNQGVVELV